MYLYPYSFIPPHLHSLILINLTVEKHLSNIRMLTDGGENAEAYLSFDEKKLIYQATAGEFEV